MKPVKHAANADAGRRVAALRRAVYAYQRALANYTPTGLGSLATGQAAAAGRASTRVEAQEK